MKRMFNKDLPKKCEYCLNAIPLGSDNEMICKKRGIVYSDDLCKKYKYDPLKRTPKKPKLANNYSPDDFII